MVKLRVKFRRRVNRETTTEIQEISIARHDYGCRTRGKGQEVVVAGIAGPSLRLFRIDRFCRRGFNELHERRRIRLWDA